MERCWEGRWAEQRRGREKGGRSEWVTRVVESETTKQLSTLKQKINAKSDPRGEIPRVQDSS